MATLVSRANDDFGQAEPARFAANAFAANGAPAYRYRFSYVQTAMRERMRTGAPHGGEISFVFGTLTDRPGSPLSPEDQEVPGMAQSYWVNFAKTGDPNGAGIPAWPRDDPSKDLRFLSRWHGQARSSAETRKLGTGQVSAANQDGGKHTKAVLA